MGDTRPAFADASMDGSVSHVCLPQERFRLLCDAVISATVLLDLLVLRIGNEEICRICSGRLTGAHGHDVHCRARLTGSILEKIGPHVAARTVPSFSSLFRDGNQGVDPAESAERFAEDRVKACLRFCDGIETELIERQLPLASKHRQRWEEITHLRRALPWLPEADV